MATPTLVLSYAPARPRTRTRRWILVAVLVVGVGLAAVYRARISLEAQFRFREWQCRHLPLPADQVVYSSVPEDVSRLKSDPRYILISGSAINRKADAVLLRAQPCWQEWNKLTLNGTMNRPTVLFQSMKTPGGREVTVAIAWSGSTQHSFVYERKSLIGKPERLRSTCLAPTYFLVAEESGRLRVFPPHVDQANASRVIIPFEVAGRRMEAVGTLREDGSMMVSVPKRGS